MSFSEGIPTATTIAAILSAALMFFPVVADWFKKQTFSFKRGFVVFACTLIGVLSFLSAHPLSALQGASVDQLVIALIYLAQNIGAAVGMSQLWHGQVNEPLAGGKG